MGWLGSCGESGGLGVVGECSGEGVGGMESWGQELFFKFIWESGRKFGLRCSSLRQRCLRIAEGVGVRGAHDVPHPHRAAEEVDLALADTLDAVDPAQDAAGFERLDGL